MTENKKNSTLGPIIVFGSIIAIVLFFGSLVYLEFTNPQIENGEYIGMMISYTNESYGYSLKFSDGRIFYVTNEVYNEGKIIGMYDYLSVGSLYKIEFQIKTIFLMQEMKVTAIKQV